MKTIEIDYIKQIEIYDTNYKVYLGANGHLYLYLDGGEFIRIKRCKRDKIKKLKRVTEDERK